MGFYIRPTWPFTYEELYSWDGLAVTVEHDVVRLWLVATGTSWDTSRRRKCEIIEGRMFWEAKCLLFEYKTGQGLTSRSYVLSSHSHIQYHSIASLPDILSSREFVAHYSDMGRVDYTYDGAHRHRRLGRTCRLVCRDWAKQLPLGDSDLRVVDDVVWHCVEDVWRVLPKRHWAWQFRRIEWWMEPRHQDRKDQSWSEFCKAWYPKLIQPIDDSAPSKDQAISTLSSSSITSKQYRTHLEPCFGPRFLENVRDMNERELYRTCRLVCRDWKKQFPIKVPGRGRLWWRGGVMWYLVEGGWRVLPSGYWAWALQDMMWWAEKFCPELSGCTKMRCRCKAWYPKLLQPIDDTIRQNREYPTPTVGSLKCKPPAFATASSLPPELFKYICSGADNESRSCRLVCRHWNEQCTSRVFEVIKMNQSPERIRALWKVRAHPTFKPHVKMIDEVPRYNESKDAKFPWIHLLTQICASTRAVWRNDGREAHIHAYAMEGRIRSIHHALPRSVPGAFSCGVQSLHLYGVRVRQMEDLTHLACELPDLEKLWCNGLTFDLLPAELPRRRPRKSCNKLKEVDLAWTKVVGAESPPPPAIPMLSLFLGVYDAKSFVSDDVITAILATLSLADPYFKDHLVCIYDPKEQTRQLEFQFTNDVANLTYLRFKVSSAHNTTTLQVGIKYGGSLSRPVRYPDRWKALDPMFGRLRSGSLEVCTQVVIGFYMRRDMDYFAEDVLGQLPSISEHFEVQYSAPSINEPGEGWHWRQASLDSKELRGEPKESLFDVYP